MEKCRILIVEDEIIVSLHIRSVLQHFNYKVMDIVSTGEEAIEKAGLHKPDLVLMDIHLGGRVDGILASAAIREKYDIPTIYLTSYNDEDTINKAKITEPLGYLVKPIDNTELRNAIELALYRHNAEKQLKESEQRYKALFDGSLDLILLQNPEGKILDANKTSIHLLEYSLTEIKELEISDILMPSQIPQINRLIKDVKEGKQQKSPLEIKMLNKNGDIIITEALFSLINRDKCSYSIQISARDITARKNAEKILVEQEQSYKSLIETSIDAIYVFQGRRLMLVNKAWQELFGYTAEEACSDSFDIMKIVAPVNIKSITDRFDRFENRPAFQNMSSRYEMIGITRDGREINLEVSASEIIWKGQSAVQGIYRDITERKKAEEQIIKLSRAVQQSPASTMVIDSRGIIEYVNDKFIQNSGYSAEQLIGRHAGFLSENVVSQDVYAGIRKKIKSGCEWQGEIESIKPDGSPYWSSISISPVCVENNKISHFIIILLDITEKKKQEEQLINAKENAEKSDRLKTEFLAQMSHEIRTPLNNILTYTSILREEFEDKLPLGMESAFTVINSSSQRLVRTIDLILNLSKIQTGNFDTHFKEFDINKDLLEDLAFEFYSRAKVKNIALQYNNRAERTKIVADHYSTEQIFLNLIDNAIKYTSEGEVIIEITNKKENAVCVSISDTGIGISQEFLPNLFNPFSQEDMGMTRHFDGTGLGLALVKKYVEINNAFIKVESEKGRGSRFMLTFSTAN